MKEISPQFKKFIADTCKYRPSPSHPSVTWMQFSYELLYISV